MTTVRLRPGPRPFGAREHERPILVEIVRRLASESLGDVVRWLLAERVPSARGRAVWRASQVHRMTTSRIARLVCGEEAVARAARGLARRSRRHWAEERLLRVVRAGEE